MIRLLSEDGDMTESMMKITNSKNKNININHHLRVGGGHNQQHSDMEVLNKVLAEYDDDESDRKNDDDFMDIKALKNKLTKAMKYKGFNVNNKEDRDQFLTKFILKLGVDTPLETSE